MRAANAALFASIEKRYGVPAGPLIAIWGMETAFGSFMGNQPTLSAVATLAYDCRRPEYFTDQLYAALQLIDRGVLSGATRGAMHGEVGQTQFLPKSILLYGVDGDGNGVVNLNAKADALASTANFLKGHGWVRGAGYQPGQPNFAAIQGWNAAGVYQQAIAIIGRRIDRQLGRLPSKLGLVAATNLRYLLSVTEPNDQATEGKGQSSRALAQALGKLIALVLVVIAVILIERYCRIQVSALRPGREDRLR